MASAHETGREPWRSTSNAVEFLKATRKLLGLVGFNIQVSTADGTYVDSSAGGMLIAGSLVNKK